MVIILDWPEVGSFLRDKMKVGYLQLDRVTVTDGGGCEIP